MRSADSSKNRVWTLSLWKLGQVYLRRSVNWVIVGVNYIISHQQRFLWCQKKLQAGYLWQSDWCDNMPIRSYKYVPVLPVNMSRPYFSTRPQATREKFGVWDETKWDLARTLNQAHIMDTPSDQSCTQKLLATYLFKTKPIATYWTNRKLETEPWTVMVLCLAASWGRTHTM